MKISITGTATFYAGDEELAPTRDEVVEALDGAEFHIMIEGKSFRIEIEHDPHGSEQGS